MPVSFDPNITVYDNIETQQKRIKNGEIDYQKYDEEMKAIYASVFAMRTSVMALPDKKDLLKVKTTQAVYDEQNKLLMASPTFAAFVKENQDTPNDIRKGHGGAAEAEFRKHVLKQDQLPTDVPGRYMPSCRERVEKLKEDLKDKDAKSAEAIRIYSEIFRARRSVGARHGEQKEKIDLTIGGANLSKTPDLAKNKTFQRFVEEKGEDLKKSMTAWHTHGGEAEHMFRDYVNGLDHIPEDVPQQYMPTAGMRIDELKKKIKSPEFEGFSDEKKQEIYIELMAARSCVGAVHKDGKTVERYMDPKNNRAWVNYWNHSATLKNFLKENPVMAKKAALGGIGGHGGQLEEKLQEYVVKLDKLPADIPKQYMPNADKRIEALQDKIGDSGFDRRKPEEKLDVYAQLMATRDAVHAVKGEQKSLEKPIDTEKYQQAYKDWMKNRTFKGFINANPAAAKSAARSGHGGELGEKFKEYVKHLDHIPADIPQPFLPEAKERTKILQDKIKGTRDAKKRAELYKELMATRACVESSRNDAKTLEKKINAGKLNEVYGTLNKSVSVKNFISKTPGDQLYDAARSGHGGALDDAYRDYVVERTYTIGTVPSGVPERFRPSPDQLLTKYKNEISAASRGKSDAWYEQNRDKIMKRTAQALYLTQVNAQSSGTKDKLEKMSHDKMQDGVQNIMNDGKFKNMFANMGPKEAVRMMSGKNMMPLISAYRNAPEPAPRVNPVNAVQDDPVLQQQQPANRNLRPVQPHP